MSEPLLSVVVPTRNRLECALSLVQGFAAFRDPRVEMVVHDNSDVTELASEIAKVADPRVRYFHAAKPMTMHENFDRAIGEAKGYYICALGDDDGMILSEALGVLELARKINADAVLSAVPVFTWPGTRHRIWGESRGELHGLERIAPECGRRSDPRTARDELFASGLVHSLGGLPRVYQGFVRRSSLAALKAHCGTLFPGPSPDIANAVALAPFVNEIYVTTRPAVISGHSPRSGGGAGSSGAHHGLLEDQAHLPHGTIENWTPAVPRFWSGPTIYAQSAIVACRASGDTVPRIGYAQLYATCFVYEPRRYWPLVFGAMRHAPDSGVGLVLRTAWHTARLVGVRGMTLIRNWLQRRLTPASDSFHFPDISAVMSECERRIALASSTQ